MDTQTRDNQHFTKTIFFLTMTAENYTIARETHTGARETHTGEKHPDTAQQQQQPSAREQILALREEILSLREENLSLKMALGHGAKAGGRSRGRAVAEAPPRQMAEGADTATLFRHLIQHTEADLLLERLHQLIDGCRGADVGSVLLHCVQRNYLKRKPTRKEFTSEFVLLGSWTSIHNYMDEGNLNALDRANRINIF